MFSRRSPDISAPGEVPRTRIVLSIYDDFDNPYYAGGGPVVVARVAAALAERHRVLILTAGRRWAVRGDGAIRKVCLPLVWAGPRGGQILWGLLIPFAAMTMRYGLWIETFTPPMSSNFIPLVTRRPVIGLAQALSGRSIADRYRTSLPLRFERLLLRTYRDIVVLNDHDATEVRRCAAAARVHIIPNAVDLPARLPLPAACGQHILYLGRIDVREKGLDLLLQAYASLGTDRLPLRIAGTGIPRQQSTLTQLLTPFDTDVRWVGKVSGEAKQELFEHAAFVVVPSREETFSLVALEAMVRGRPVIFFDLPQLDWIPEDCGVRVPRFDAAALARAMRLLTDDLSVRCEKGMRGLAYGTARLQDFNASYRILVDRLLSTSGDASPAARADASSLRHGPVTDPMRSATSGGR